ncbi:MAG TPA: metallophosphoesterase family protein [Acidimicrobiales bacterium]|nr:metallophosphoesterase family protein [Acidimicrobiales bacterium]
MTEGTIKPHVVSRRDFLRISAGAGAVVVGGKLFWLDGYAFAASGTSGGGSTLGTGTVPEQVHLQYGADPTTEMSVSWATPVALGSGQTMGLTLSPAVAGQTSFTATTKTYTDGPSGEEAYLYHVPLTGLAPNTTYTYTIADPNSTATFQSSFTTAPTGRFAFAFTSFGDLAEPGTGATYTWAGENAYSNTYGESDFNSYWAVQEVETLAATMTPPPMFHLLNGDLAYADKWAVPGASPPSGYTYSPAPQVWRDFGLNVQYSASKRPWMTCIGNHEVELDQSDPQGYASYNSRYLFPANGASGFVNNFYYFPVGSVLFISLDANDVCYQGSGAYNVYLAASTDGAGDPISASAHQYNQQYSGTFGSANSNGTINPGNNAQTVWLQNVLAAARPSLVPTSPSSPITAIPSIDATSIDWIIVMMHQSALSSSNDNGSDAGIRQLWVPLFDQYEVDLVVNGHDHDYERSYPVRGVTASPYPGYSVFGAATGNIATLSAASGTSATTSLSLAAPGTSAAVTSGETLQLVSGGVLQTFTVNGAQAAGTTTLAVTSFTPTVNFPAGAQVQISSAWNKGWPTNSIYGTGGVASYTGPAAGTAVNTLTPVVTQTSPTITTSEGLAFDATKGTIYLVLGGGGTNKPDNDYGAYNSSGALVSGRANVTTFTQIRVGSAVGGAKAGTKPLPDSSEPNSWSAVQGTGDISSPTNTTSDGNNSYGIAYFSVDPGEPGGNTQITMTWYETSQVTTTSNPQGGTAPTYTKLDSFVITRPRSDVSAALPEFPLPAAAVAGAAVLVGGAAYLSQRKRQPAGVGGD